MKQLLILTVLLLTIFFTGCWSDKISKDKKIFVNNKEVNYSLLKNATKDWSDFGYAFVGFEGDISVYTSDFTFYKDKDIEILKVYVPQDLESRLLQRSLLQGGIEQ